MSELLLPVAIRLSLLLAIGFAVASVLHRGPGRLADDALFRKVGTWAFVAPAFLVALFVGGWVGLLIIGFASVHASSEYARLLGLPRRQTWVLIVSAVCVLPLAGLGTIAFLSTPVLVAFMVLLVAMAGADDFAREAGGTVLAFIHVPFLLASLVHAREGLSDGLVLVLLVGVAVALSDVTAFVVGSLVGGRRLAPRVSPNKTWAGAVGNLLGAYVGWWLMSFAVSDWGVGLHLAIPAVIGVFALLGDLSISVVKRAAHVKDAGSMLPGFGGVLDRIDSLLLAFPVAYVAFVFIGSLR